MKPENAYASLIALAREQAVLASCADLLEWDEEAAMPRGGVEHRCEQRVLLAGLLHERRTSPRMGELLGALAGSPLERDADSPEAANIRELRREYERQVRLPRALVEERARVATLSQQVWAEAREEGDFARFAPWLERTVRLCREEGQALAEGAGCAPPGAHRQGESEQRTANSEHADRVYDALLEGFEPGATGAGVAALFADLRKALAPLIAAISGGKKRPRPAALRRPFAVDRQRLFAQAVAASLGFDLERGRMDTAGHPFCIALGPGDTRLTARFSERAFGEGFFATLHEVGHGLYEQGLEPAHWGTPMGRAASLGIHESQSRLWENIVGRSAAFWRHFFPRLRNVFPEALAGVKPEAWHQAVNRVEATTIRAQADEVTYNLHIMIRFDLERALLGGALAPADLPGAWRAAYRDCLGVEPENHADGCMQDGHWAEGLFGYFPTYTLGNVYAAQMYAAAGAQTDDLEGALGRGEFGGLLGWLREHIHRQGQRWRPADLVRRATGGAPDHRALVEMLRQKYSALYGL